MWKMLWVVNIAMIGGQILGVCPLRASEIELGLQILRSSDVPIVFLLSSEDVPEDGVVCGEVEGGRSNCSVPLTDNSAWIEIAPHLLIVTCKHGYRHLLQKMTKGLDILLRLYPDMMWFLRIDVDIQFPWYVLPAFLSSPPTIPNRRFLHDLRVSPSCLPYTSALFDAVTNSSMIRLGCHLQCALLESCLYFCVDSETSRCSLGATLHDFLIRDGDSAGDSGLYMYSARANYQKFTHLQIAGEMEELPPAVTKRLEQREEEALPMLIVGTILAENRVWITEEGRETHWVNTNFSADLGLQSYPPYPEASAYLMSRAVAEFLGHNSRSWTERWSVEDASVGTLLAGTRTEMVQWPVEVRRLIKVLRKEETESLR